jgi:hypothetical protein
MSGEIPLGELFVSVKADTEDLQKGMEESKEAVEGMQNSVDKTSTGLDNAYMKWNRLGRLFAILGAGIVYTTKKMIDTASEVSDVVGESWGQLSSDMTASWDELSVVIAGDVIPIIKQLWYESLKPVLDWFMNLPPNTRSTIVTFGFIAGIIGMVAGAFKLMQFAGVGSLGTINTAAGVTGSSVLGVLGGIAMALLLLVPAWMGAFDEMSGVMGTFGRALHAGMLVIKIALEGMAISIVETFKGMLIGIQTVINGFLRLVQDMANAVIGIVNTIIDAVNWVGGKLGLGQIQKIATVSIQPMVMPGLADTYGILSSLYGAQASDFAELSRLQELEKNKGMFGTAGAEQISRVQELSNSSVTNQVVLNGDINIDGSIDPSQAKTFAKQMLDYFDDEIKRVGLGA